MSQSRAEQFYAEYTKTEKSRIPDKALYDEIINFLVGIETERLRDPHTYINWRNRYKFQFNIK
jgi:hypothetical protein